MFGKMTLSDALTRNQELKESLQKNMVIDADKKGKFTVTTCWIRTGKWLGFKCLNPILLYAFELN